MLAVCTSDYGEMTDSPYCTYYELKLAKEYNVDVLPLQVEDNWKPNPPCGEGHHDHSKSALSFIHAVFIPSIVRIDGSPARLRRLAQTCVDQPNLSGRKRMQSAGSEVKYE